MAKYVAVSALYTAAETDWKTGKDGAASLLSMLEALDETDTIKAYVHNYADYVKVEAAYLAYVEAYYAGAITNAQFGELTTYAAFATVLAECKTAKADADAKIVEIEEAIAAVLAATDVPADVISLALTASDRIEEYAAFCDNMLTDTCLDHELLLDFCQAVAYAQFEQYVAEAIARTADADKQAKLEETLVQFNQMIKFGDLDKVQTEAKTLEDGIAQVGSALETAKNAVDTIAPAPEYT